MDTSKNLEICENISKFVKQHITLFEKFENVYLFGSVLGENKVPNDIDMLIIYSEYSNIVVDALSLVRFLFEEASKLPIHLTVLSVEEEKEIGFLKRINHLYLKLK